MPDKMRMRQTSSEFQAQKARSRCRLFTIMSRLYNSRLLTNATPRPKTVSIQCDQGLLNMPRELPKIRRCGATEVHQRLCEMYPEFRVRRGEIHFQTARLIQRGAAMQRVQNAVIRIPVVVHVVFNDP